MLKGIWLQMKSSCKLKGGGGIYHQKKKGGGSGRCWQLWIIRHFIILPLQTWCKNINVGWKISFIVQGPNIGGRDVTLLLSIFEYSLYWVVIYRNALYTPGIFYFYEILKGSYNWSGILNVIFYTPRNEVARGIMFLTRPSVRPSVRLSVRLSVRPSVSPVLVTASPL